MTSTPEDQAFEVVEICAGAGGQALGLEKAGFEHRLAVELDPNAFKTLKTNLEKIRACKDAVRRKNSGQEAELQKNKHQLALDFNDEGTPEKVTQDFVRLGDVADPAVFNPAKYEGIALFAGGVPCPPFTIAGKQLGASDERDLFAWAIEQVGKIKPRALLLENVRGLSLPRFAGYRQHVLDHLIDLGYAAEWRLLNASDFGVPQLRPRFVLVAMKPEDMAYFSWPEPTNKAATVGDTIFKLMKAGGWPQAKDWKKYADKIAPTIVGGSKKHGGADLGPTRAKRAWRELCVDAMGLANTPPGPDDEYALENGEGPKLTNEMVAQIQGWLPGYVSGWLEGFKWEFTGLKTSRYRQIGNAFPPPVAEAIGRSILSALKHETKNPANREMTPHDPVYRILRDRTGEFISTEELIEKAGLDVGVADLERRITLLKRDFVVEEESDVSGALRYCLGEFKAFVGQEDHERHVKFEQNRAKIS
ncbi:DNA cytosine methyltransferase [Amycolatopsis sp. NPDC004368]